MGIETLKTIDAIHTFLHEEKIGNEIIAKVSWKGRRFVFKGTEFGLNDIIKLVQIYAKAPKPNSVKVLEIIKKIQVLDRRGDNVFRKEENCLVKIITFLRRLFGNMGFNRTEALKNLYNQFKNAPQDQNEVETNEQEVKPKDKNDVKSKNTEVSDSELEPKDNQVAPKDTEPQNLKDQTKQENETSTTLENKTTPEDNKKKEEESAKLSATLEEQSKDVKTLNTQASKDRATLKTPKRRLPSRSASRANLKDIFAESNSEELNKQTKSDDTPQVNAPPETSKTQTLAKSPSQTSEIPSKDLPKDEKVSTTSISISPKVSDTQQKQTAQPPASSPKVNVKLIKTPSSQQLSSPTPSSKASTAPTPPSSLPPSPKVPIKVTDDAPKTNTKDGTKASTAPALPTSLPPSPKDPTKVAVATKPTDATKSALEAPATKKTQTTQTPPTSGIPTKVATKAVIPPSSAKDGSTKGLSETKTANGGEAPKKKTLPPTKQTDAKASQFLVTKEMNEKLNKKGESKKPVSKKEESSKQDSNTVQTSNTVQDFSKDATRTNPQNKAGYVDPNKKLKSYEEKRLKRKKKRGEGGYDTISKKSGTLGRNSNLAKVRINGVFPEKDAPAKINDPEITPPGPSKA